MTKPDKHIVLAQRLYDALKRISMYQKPDALRRSSQKQYGLESEEAIEYAYENVLQEAASAIKGVRRPVQKTPNEQGHRPETAGGRNGSGGPKGSASPSCED